VARPLRVTLTVGYSNPQTDFPNISKGIINLIYGWNWLWESVMNDQDRVNKQHFVGVFRAMGFELAKQVDQFYPCSYEDAPIFY
jgi:hypothetical protein